jgi:hypothetical protein
LIPEMDHILRVGDRFFVAVERLDRNGPFFPPVGDSYIAVFDGHTEQFIDADPVQAGTQALRLTGTNPFGELVLNPESPVIWVPTVGRFDLLDGGLEIIDPATLTSSGLVLTEATLGGNLTDVVPIDENRGVAIISDANFNNLLVGFDLSTPGVIDTLYAPGGFFLQDAELSRDGRIFLADRTTANPGLRVFDGATWNQITTSPVDVCLPPYDIEFGRR